MSDGIGEFRFAKPGSTSGGGFRIGDHDGHLLAFVAPELMPSMQTSYGEKDAVRCTFVVDLDVETVENDVYIYQTALVPALVGEEEIVLGRVGQGSAKPGRSAPWILFDPTEDDEERARKFFDVHTTRLKSGAITIEAPAPAGADEEF